MNFIWLVMQDGRPHYRADSGRAVSVDEATSQARERAKALALATGVTCAWSVSAPFPQEHISVRADGATVFDYEAAGLTPADRLRAEGVETP